MLMLPRADLTLFATRCRTRVARPSCSLIPALLSSWATIRPRRGGRRRSAGRTEHQTLWNLTCLLERELVEPFSPDYGNLIEQA